MIRFLPYTDGHIKIMQFGFIILIWSHVSKFLRFALSFADISLIYIFISLILMALLSLASKLPISILY